MAIKDEFIDLVLSEYEKGLNPPKIARKKKVKLHKVYYVLQKIGAYPKKKKYGTQG